MSNFKWGIDLGGTKIEGVVLDANNEVVIRHRIPTQREGGYQHILSRIALLVEELKKTVGSNPVSIGIGTPGTIDPPTGLLKNSNTVVLNGQPFLTDIEAVLGENITVKMANDANCFAIAEALMGCVKEEKPEAEVVFGVILGTGVGGGLVVNDRMIGGAQGIGGEWGHMFLDHSGGHCYCGRVGCVETIISGPALERFYAGISGKGRSMREIATRYVGGRDSAATATLDRLFHFFAKGIANIINVLDPDVIVLGGGLGQIDALYEIGVPQVTDHLFNPRMDTVFLRPALGDSAGVYGAALL
ncbi:sugar kinase [Lewinellaceae bacterium SD302]|nr:sugar kinase [Lewinellaceae bacterium SD302]